MLNNSDSSIDCDFTTGECPLCHARAKPHVRRNCPKKKPSAVGPGAELQKLTAELGIRPKSGCDCSAIARQMDAWGIEGCQDRREEILARMAKNYQEYDWQDKLKATVKAVTSGLAWRINPLDPLGSILDEAIRRAS